MSQTHPPGFAGLRRPERDTLVLRMNKMSSIVLKLAEEVLLQPTEKSSREAVAVALLLTNVAWNRAVDPMGGDQVGSYRKVIEALRRENPKCLKELRSTNFETMIQDLARLKLARHPRDKRVIHLCGITPENTVRVEWRDGPTVGAN
ncbi:MAG TPA: hypothetical protein PKM43_17675 [Verrucomicrobiota bacterium]|nr:hypothetical protein [Verrucomicrobiota bacterium]HRZ55409.1 hypothetical protein [Candidatus Paceibacterota bacterium]